MWKLCHIFYQILSKCLLKFNLCLEAHSNYFLLRIKWKSLVLLNFLQVSKLLPDHILQIKVSHFACVWCCCFPRTILDGNSTQCWQHWINNYLSMYLNCVWWGVDGFHNWTHLFFGSGCHQYLAQHCWSIVLLFLLSCQTVLFLKWLVNEYPTMHYFGNPGHTQSKGSIMILTEYFWKFLWKIALWEFCYWVYPPLETLPTLHYTFR